MKVVILAQAGKEIGLGHLTRCLALYDAFKEKNIIPLLIINGDKSILDFLKGKNYKIFNWLKQKGNLLNRIKDADIVIVDSYLAPKSLYDKIFQLVPGRLVMIDDFKRIDYPPGIVVNPSIYGDKLNYPKKEGVTYLLGKDYIILRKEFWRVPKKVINKEVKNILVTFGGMNHSNLANRIVNFLKKKHNLYFQIIDANKNKFTAKKMLNLMLKADIAISGGGQTTYELARVGVPTIGICFARNQLFNLRYGSKVGYLKFAGQFSDRGLFNKIKEIMIDLTYNKRIKMSESGKNSVDGMGVRRVVNKVMEER